MEAENPFKGASSYEDGDSFYGRENEIKELTSLVRNESLTLLFSRSGTGKSSLLKAGLFPALKSQSEFFPVYIHLNDAAVKETSASNFSDYVIKICKKEINNYFNGKENYKITLPENIRPDSLFQFVHNIKIIEVETASASEYIIKPVLVFDQLEEIFTNPVNKNELQFLLKEIRCLIENEIPDYLKNDVAGTESNEYQKLKNTLKSKQKNFRIVFSFREEYLPQFESLRKEVPAIRFTNGRYRLEPFTIDTAKDIITRTAPLIKDKIAEIVAENIATEVEGFDEKRVDPFLLSLICQIIYADLLVDKNLSPGDTNARIKSLVENALESYVTKVYGEINDETKKFIEDKLITTDGKKSSVNYNEVEDKDLKSDILKLVNNPDLRLLSIGQFLDSKHITILHDRLLPPLIQRKNERKFKEENDAFVLRRQEMEKANKKKTRAILLYFLLGTIGLITLLSFTLREKNRVRIATNKSDSAYQEANHAKALADLSEKRNVAMKQLADEAILTAKQSQEKALMLTKLADDAKRFADISKQAYQSQKELTALLQKSIDTNNVQRDLLNNNITYTTLDVNDYLQDEIFNTLFTLKNNHEDEKYQQLLQSITAAINAKRQVLADSLEGFFNAKELWQKNKNNTITESIIHSFINKPVYYKQATFLSGESNFDNSGKTFLSFSDVQKHDGQKDFSFNYHNTIYTGNYNAAQDTMVIHPGVAYSIDTDPVTTGNTNQGPNTIMFKSLVNHHDTITALANNYLYVYAPGEKKPYRKYLIPAGKYSDAVLSNDAKHLITYSNFDSVILWNINKPDDIKKTVLKVKSGGIISIIFSQNSDKFLILERWEISLFKVDALLKSDTAMIANKINDLYFYDKIKSANFSADGEKLIAAGFSNIYMRDLNKADTLYPAYSMPTYTVLKAIALSPDSKKIIIETSDNILVGENGTASSLVSDRGNFAQPLFFKKFYSNNTSRATAFLSSNSILSINDTGNVFLIKTYPDFQNVNEAFNTIQQSPLPLINRLKADPDNKELFAQVLNSNDIRTVRNAARFYSSNNNNRNSDFRPDFLKSVHLYDKLLTFDNNTNIPDDAGELIKVLAELGNIDTSEFNKAVYYRKLTAIAKKYEFSTEFINVFKNLSGSDTSQVNRYIYYKKIIEIAENNQDAEPQMNLSVDYGNLAFYSFFTRNFNDGLAYAFKGLALDSSKDTANNYIITNIALGYLLTNHFDSAEYYYARYKDQFIKTNNQSFKEGFIQDLEYLESWGIISKNDNVLYEEVQRIKNKILQ